MPHPDDIGLVADAAIQELGMHALSIEVVVMRMPDSPERAELVRLVESLRDQEQIMRDRIAAIARSMPR